MLRFRAVNSRVLGVLPGVYAGVLVATAACSGASGMETVSGSGAGLDNSAATNVDVDVNSDARAVPVAHVDIEHSRNVGFESAQAIAHFVYSRDARPGAGAAPFSAVVSGSRDAIPEPGRCQDLTAGGLASAAPVTLLEAGTVVIHTQPPAGAVVPARDESALVEAEAADVPASESAVDETALSDLANDEGAVTEPAAVEPAAPVTISLAPRAFPGLSSLASGVMYTSRDRDVPLPALAQYEVNIEGSAQVPAMSLRGVAPAYLRHVTVGGTPLEQVTFLNPGSPIDLTWDIGSGSDVVLVDLTNPQDGRAVLRCSYSDAAGAGTVPWVAPLAELALDSTRAELHVHRVRVVESAATDTSNGSGAARGQLRFDFELTRDIEFR